MFISFLRKLIIFSIFIFIICLIIVYIDVNIPKVNNVSIETDKLPKGSSLKLIQISDLHAKDFGDGYKKLLSKIEGFEPDGIVITGDFIDHKTSASEFNRVYDFVEALYNINPKIYYVPGNHELANVQGLAFIKGIEDRGVLVLRNKNAVLSSKNMVVNICGVDDIYNGRPDLKKSFKGIDSSLFTILLSHAPNIVFTRVDNCDLILSGHTHGGQVRLPIIGPVVIPNQGFLPKYDKGLFQISESQQLYIDSGLGTSLLPIRFLNRSQISFISINNSDESDAD